MGGLLSASRAVAATAAGGGLLAAAAAWSRGMTATVHRESKYCVGQFFLCGKIAEAASRSAGAVGGEGGGEGGEGGGEGGDGGPRLAAQVAGAVLGGVACTAVSHPDDVIKTRMQTHLRGSPHFSAYPSYSRSGLHILRHEGLAALFKGSAFRCLLRVPLGLSLIICSGEAIREGVAERRRGRGGECVQTGSS